MADTPEKIEKSCEHLLPIYYIETVHGTIVTRCQHACLKETNADNWLS